MIGEGQKGSLVVIPATLHLLLEKGKKDSSSLLKGLEEGSIPIK